MRLWAPSPGVSLFPTKILIGGVAVESSHTVVGLADVISDVVSPAISSVTSPQENNYG